MGSKQARPGSGPAAEAAHADRAAQAPEVIAELKEATRAAHEAAQDLAAVIRQAREFLAGELPAGVEARIAGEVDAGLAAYKDQVDAKIAEAQAGAVAQFDATVARLLGHDSGQPFEETLARYLHRVRTMGQA